MAFLLGIDLGTSSVKAVIIDERTHIRGIGQREYPLLVPRPGYAEQNAEDWWQAVVVAVRGAVAQADTRQIDAIGFSGHMHSGVLLDSAHKPVGPAIIWADQRTSGLIDEVVSRAGWERFASIAGTLPAAGFMAPNLYWLQRNDPQQLDRARSVLLPKDYLRFRMTGEIATEPSDASATALFDIQQRRWSSVIIEALGLPPGLWPEVIESSAVAGTLTRTAADELGLPAGISAVAGSADQPAQAMGNGLIDPGLGSVTIGTGGQLFAPLLKPRIDERLRLHTFCHAAADRWYLLGAMLSAGLSLRWLRDVQGMAQDPDAYEKLASLANEVPPGAGGLFFLPYLVGERAPIMDPLARGGFIGLTLQHGLGHLTRAIMEGVAFTMRDILDLMLALGTPIEQLLASGNGLRNPVWRHIMADVLARPLRLSTGAERAGVGAAVLAGQGIGIYKSLAEVKEAVAMPFEITEPDARRAAIYAEQFARYRQVYPLLKETFHSLSRDSR
ncbi:MAG TPA: xylulokinase [Aggregatilineales bacterium]|nr:xylulokinase [Aggregatilineales bacterium]